MSRGKRRLTASGLPRAIRCLYSFRDDVELLPDEPSISTRIGRQVHSCVEAMINGPTMLVSLKSDLAPSYQKKAAVLCESWLTWWNESPLRLRKWETEIKFAYKQTERNGAVVARLTTAGHRDYADHDGLCGTADAVSSDGGLLVVDWKTGHGLVSAMSPQLRFLGAVAARWYSASSVTVAIGQITPDTVLWNERVLEKQDIDEVLEDADALLRMVPDSEPIGGDWCRYCQTKNCPERRVPLPGQSARESSALSSSRLDPQDLGS